MLAILSALFSAWSNGATFNGKVISGQGSGESGTLLSKSLYLFWKLCLIGLLYLVQHLIKTCSLHELSLSKK